MVHITVRTWGAKQVETKFDDMIRRFPIVASGMTLEMAKDFVTRAKSIIGTQSKYHGKTPGRLADSFTYQRMPNGIKVENIAPYAGMVEYGTPWHEQPNSIIMKFRMFGHPGANAMGYAEQAFNLSVGSFKRKAAQAATRLVK